MKSSSSSSYAVSEAGKEGARLNLDVIENLRDDVFLSLELYLSGGGDVRNDQTEQEIETGASDSRNERKRRGRNLMMAKDMEKKIQALAYQGVLIAQVPVKAIKAELMRTAKVVITSRMACLEKVRRARETFEPRSDIFSTTRLWSPTQLTQLPCIHTDLCTGEAVRKA